MDGMDFHMVIFLMELQDLFVASLALKLRNLEYFHYIYYNKSLTRYS